MQSRPVWGALLRTAVVAALVIGCRTGGGGFISPFGNYTGPCVDVSPIAWADSLIVDGRSTTCPDSPWDEPSRVLGESDGLFASLGPASMDFLVVETGLDIVDFPGADLVVYEVFGDEASRDDYDVYLSQNADSNFVFLASIEAEGTYCIDVHGSGISRGRFVKIIGAAGAAVPDSIAPCDSTFGADIDAIGVLNTDMSIDEICRRVGEDVDLACPPDGEYENHGEYVSCVAHEANVLLIAWREYLSAEQSGQVHGCIISQRSQDDVGKAN